MVSLVLNTGVDPHCKASVVDTVEEGTLTDADFRGCRWIDGDPSPLRRGMFCGLPVASGESWCAEHRGVVFGANLEVDCRAHGLAGGSVVGWQSRRGAGFVPPPNRREH